MKDLTDTQRKVLAFIQLHTTEYGYCPSFREIAREFGYKSVRAATSHVEALVHKGMVRRPMHVPRSIIITPEGVLALQGVSYHLPFDFTRFGEVIPCRTS